MLISVPWLPQFSLPRMVLPPFLCPKSHLSVKSQFKTPPLPGTDPEDPHWNSLLPPSFSYQTLAEYQCVCSPQPSPDWELPDSKNSVAHTVPPCGVSKCLPI